jgi:hypothetical protein
MDGRTPQRVQRTCARKRGAREARIPRGRYSPLNLPGDLLTSDEVDRGYRTEEGGFVHAVEGSRLAPSAPKTFFMWARCGPDVAVTAVWVGKEAPLCLCRC